LGSSRDKSRQSGCSRAEAASSAERVDQLLEFTVERSCFGWRREPKKKKDEERQGEAEGPSVKTQARSEIGGDGRPDQNRYAVVGESREGRRREGKGEHADDEKRVPYYALGVQRQTE